MPTVTSFPHWEAYAPFLTSEEQAVAYVQSIIDNPPPSRPALKVRRLVKETFPAGGHRWYVEETTYSTEPVLEFNADHPDDILWDFPAVDVRAV